MTHPLTQRVDMLQQLERWTQRGWLRELDWAFVRFLDDELDELEPLLALAAALVSHQLGRGHVCLDLAAVLEDPSLALSLPPDQGAGVDSDWVVSNPAELLAGLRLNTWLERLQQAAGVGGEDSAGGEPLVLVGHRLYLRRSWRYERQLEQAMTTRLQLSGEIAAALPEAPCQAMLDALFPPQATGAVDWQKVACALAARSAFSVVTGGPGTGKTTTVVRLLALLQSLALAQGAARPLRIRLAAPTGKAAARLKEAIGRAIETLPQLPQLPEVLLDHAALTKSIPREVTTLHRLLGTRPDTRRFRHHERNPLPLDVLVIDEGSMIDLEMMSAVLQALPAAARLVLLGDKDQLASVEAGSVLGELCARAANGHYQPDTVAWLQRMTGLSIPEALQDARGSLLDQHVAMLRDSHRFEATSGIGQLAMAVNAGDTAAMGRVWAAACPDLLRLDLPGLDDPRLAQLLLDESAGVAVDARQGLAGYLRIVMQHRPPLEAGREAFDAWARQVLQAHGRFQLLCALRQGAYGVTGLNRYIEGLLAKQGYIPPGAVEEAGSWYKGRPVLVTRNDYGLKLMNGDIGITLELPVRNRQTGALTWGLRVAFLHSDGSGGIHWVLPSRLTAVDTVYALTVHKSQGSEFEHCVLLLPPQRNPVVTRELVYTGITRGKRWFTLVGCGHARGMEEAVSRRVQRCGGLRL